MINDPLLGIFPFFVNLSHPSWIVTLFGVSSISQLLTYNTQFASLHVLPFVSSWSRLGLFIFANESSCCRCSCFVFLLSSNTLSLDFPVFLVAPFYPALKCVCRRSSSSSISILLSSSLFEHSSGPPFLDDIFFPHKLHVSLSCECPSLGFWLIVLRFLSVVDFFSFPVFSFDTLLR